LIALGENDFEPGPTTDARAQALREAGFAVARYNCAVFALASAALGWTDGYIEHGCGLWDIAAGAVICREAGLAVTSQEIAPDRWSIDARA
jgi:myo-inositol-1(or 4)-monophosphatase